MGIQRTKQTLRMLPKMPLPSKGNQKMTHIPNDYQVVVTYEESQQIQKAEFKRSVIIFIIIMAIGIYMMYGTGAFK